MFDSAPRPRRALEETDRSSVPSGGLDWFPKRFLAGDLDGEGQEKILGSSAIVDPSEILVRETAQNSWDARLPTAKEISFELHLRKASDDERSLLSSQVFTGGPDMARALPNLSTSLSGRDLWLLEVSDRGTKGLGGPTSSQFTADRGEVTDFRDFVLTLGAPRDTKHGGGTYGFGKTASYRASKCGSLVIWSQCRTRLGGVESRFIASAMGKSFDRAGERYTGRHWWAIHGDDAFVPVTGNRAREMGSELFHRRFAPEQTGTSLLIVAPDMGEDSPSQFARRLAKAVLKHLWPKLRSEEGRCAMRIRVLLEGVEVEIPDPTEHPVLSHFVDALDAVRQLERGEVPPLSMVRSMAVEGQPRGVGRTILGYLALKPFPRSPMESSSLLGREDVHDICLMRNSAELVVRYLPGSEHDLDKTSWAAVFKPRLKHDDAFAASEPPTHDDWAYESLADPSQKSTVRVALNKVAQLVSEWTSPPTAAPTKSVDHAPAALLADALSGLMPSASGSRAGGFQPGGRVPSGGSPKPRADVDDAVASEVHEGTRDWAFHVALTAPPGNLYSVEPRLAIATMDRDDPDDDRLELLGWDELEGPPDLTQAPSLDGEVLVAPPEISAWLRVRAPADLAVRVRFVVALEEE